MSLDLDNQATVNANNFDSQPPKKGGALKWILGGCGCLGLLLVLCVGGAFYYGFSVLDQVRQEARSFVESSSVVQEKLGSPVTIDGETLATGPDGAPSFRFDVSGPDGRGTVTASSKVDNQAGAFVVSDYVLEVDGEEFDLNAADDFDVGVEGIDDF